MRGTATSIAVIGMSCRFPGVHGLDAFWRLLTAGESTLGTFPGRRAADTRPLPADHPDAATLTTGSFFDTVDGFDAAFFGTGAAESAAMDPAQRLGLELAWEAVEDARIPAGTLAGRDIDVVVGTAPSGYELLRTLSGADSDDHYAALGSSGALIANRISSLFDVRGMSFCADSGQSSSLVSLALTCERIASGAVDLAIAGGVHLIVDPQAGLGLANLGALSPDGRCFTFDERAGGFARGEGGAFVVLKRLDLALADGDPVHAVVRGWGVASGGASSRMPDPSPEGQAAAVRAALRRADVDFDSLDYVEAHGTGTRLGDPAELAGLRAVSDMSARTRPLAVGSVKTNVGHLEPAAGITGLVKTVLCLERGHLVASLNFRTPNPAVPAFDDDFEVPTATRPWPHTPGRPRRAGVSAFGMGGTTAHVVLEQAPATPPTPLPPADGALDTAGGPETLPWVLSARSGQALADQAARLRDHLTADPTPTAADVGHSLLSTRTLFEHRAVLLAADRTEALDALAALAAGGDAPRTVRGTARAAKGPVVFVFPGQGSQWPGMGRHLYAQSAVFARSIDACARALDPWVDWSLVDVVTGAPSAASLDRVDVVQPALFAMMVSLAELWRSHGVAPDAVVGHSQGEIAAACVSGALGLQDAARIVAQRSKALTALAGQGGMSAVAAPHTWVTERLKQWPGRLSTAAVNGPASVVVSGDDEALDQFAAAAADEGVRVRRVKVDYASHSHHVERIREQLLADTADITPRASAVTFHSTVTATALDTRALNGSYWYDNLRSQVRFGDVIGALMRQSGTVFVEVSPHPVLQVAMEEAADTLAVPPLLASTLHRRDGSAGQVLASLAALHVHGVPVDWTPAFTAHHPRTVALPGYPFQRSRHWLTAPKAPAAPAAPAPGRDTRTAHLTTEQAVLALVCAETAALMSAKDTGITAADIAARPDETFKALGFDSSTAVELRNRLAAAAGLRLPATVAFTHPTARRLARHLFSLLQPPEPAPEPAAPAAPPQAAARTGPDARDVQDVRDLPDSGSDDDLYALIERGYV